MLRRRLALALGLALALAGCGGHLPATQATQAGTAAAKAKAARADSFLPTDPNFVWQYEVAAHPVDDPDTSYPGVETVRVESVRRTREGTTLTLRAIDSYTEEYRFPVMSESADGLTMRGVAFWGAGAWAVDDLAIDFLHFPLAVGARWDDGAWTGRAVAQEQVHVPAGTFSCWKVSAIGTYDHAYTAVGTYWVAPGVGVVKSELSIPNYTLESQLIPAGRKASGGPRLNLHKPRAKA
jgi:hypothetical protein